MDSPKVSVIIPCYNQGAFLKEAVDSVLNSTYKNYEIIIINDGSTDDFTIQLFESYNPRSSKIIHTDNQGPAAARNTGIGVAKGEYILPLDADDKISAEYMAEAVSVLDSSPDIGIVYSFAEMFGAKNGKWRLPAYSLDLMLTFNVIFCTAFYRKTDWMKVKGYKSDIPFGKEDWEFWLSLIELGVQVYQIPYVHFYYRTKVVSRDVLSNNGRKKNEINEVIYKYHKDIFDRYLPNPLQLHQENAYLRYLANRFDSRLGRGIFKPFFIIKKLLRIP